MLGKIAKYSNPFTGQANILFQAGKKIGNPLDLIPQNNFQPVMADITNPTNQGQINTAYDQTQTGLRQQQDFLKALQAQGGIQNQSNVFAQQQGLAEMLAMQAQGAGPNPALAEFQQATGQNVANQAALMAGQRGSGANAGLIARQAAMQGAGIQQQAAGQAAIMQANQQLAAQQALMQQQQAMAGLATNQVAQQQGALTGYNNFAQGQQQNLLNANQGYQNQIVEQTIANNRMMNENSADRARNKRQAIGKIFDAGVGMAKTFGGGMAHGGMVNGDGSVTQPSSNIGRMCMSEGGLVPGQAEVRGDSLVNDTVPAQLSPGEVVIPRSVLQSADPVKAAAAFVADVLKQKQKESGSNFASGGMVGGMASVPGMGDIVGAENEIKAEEEKDVDAFLAQQEANQMGSGASGGWGEAPNNAGLSEPSGRMPATGQTQAAVSGTSDASMGMGDFAKGVSQQQKGIADLAKAEGELGKAEARIQEESILQQKAAAASFQEQLGALDAETKAYVQDIKAQKIDPNRYIGSMDTGRKVATGIGLILGGIGAALHGGENVALKMLDKSIDQDIDAQKAELGKKQTLLSMNMQQYGNLKDATTMTRIMMAEQTKAELEKAAALSKDPIAQARAKAAIGEINQRVAPMMAQMAAKKALLGGMKNGAVDPIKAINIIVPEKDQAKARAELENIRAYKQGVQGISDIFDEVKEIGPLSANNPFSESYTKMDVANGKIEALVRKMNKGQGAFTDSDARALVAPYKLKSTDTDAQRQAKYEGLERAIREKLEAPQILQTYGIPYNLETTKLSTEQRRMLNYAKKNPNAPESAQILRKLGR